MKLSAWDFRSSKNSKGGVCYDFKAETDQEQRFLRSLYRMIEEGEGTINKNSFSFDKDADGNIINVCITSKHK